MPRPWPLTPWISGEGAGVSPWLQERARARVIIPMRGVTESLNAAVAGSVVLWLMQTAGQE